MPLAEGSHRLGSSPENGLRVSHPSISRRHAVIHLRDDRAEVEDLGSRNGTRIAGRRVTARQALNVGEAVTFGAAAAVLEEVSDKDLEPAVTFAAAPVSAPEDDAMTATAALGTTRVFALKLLPVDARSASAPGKEVLGRRGQNASHGCRRDRSAPQLQGSPKARIQGWMRVAHSPLKRRGWAGDRAAGAASAHRR